MFNYDKLTYLKRITEFRNRNKKSNNTQTHSTLTVTVCVPKYTAMSRGTEIYQSGLRNTTVVFLNPDW